MSTTVSRAIAAIYDCACDPSLWPETLQAIADCFDDVGALLLYRGENGNFVTVVSPSLQVCADAYARGWWRHDIRASRSLDYAYAAAAGAITDRHFITDDEMASHPIYTEFLAPFGLRWGAGLQLSPGGGTDVSLTVQRAGSKPPFSDEELEKLTDLGHHVERSLRLGLRLIHAEAAKVGLGEALGRIAVAAFLVEADGRIHFANQRGQGLIGPTFDVIAGRLTCQKASDRARLAGLIREAGTTEWGGEAESFRSLPLLLTGQDQARIAVYVLPAGDPSTDPLSSAVPLFVVLARDLSRGAPLDPGLIRDAYGLTLGEARIAALVGSGISPRVTAARLALSEETVRSVLKRIFDKLDVSRQAELVELFTRLKTVNLLR